MGITLELLLILIIGIVGLGLMLITCIPVGFIISFIVDVIGNLYRKIVSWRIRYKLKIIFSNIFYIIMALLIVFFLGANIVKETGLFNISWLQ